MTRLLVGFMFVLSAAVELTGIVVAVFGEGAAAGGLLTVGGGCAAIAYCYRS